MRGMKPSIYHRSHRYCHREVQSRVSIIAVTDTVIARYEVGYLSSRGTKRSRLSSIGQNRKEKLPHCARLRMSSRGTKRSRLSSAGQNRKERLPRCARNDKTREARDDKKRRNDKKVSRTGKREIATLRSQPPIGGFDRNTLSSRGMKRSRLSSASQNRKERLPRCARNDRNTVSSRGTKRSRSSSAAKTERRDCRPELANEICHREERSDLGFLGWAKTEKRDCRAALAMTNLERLAMTGNGAMTKLERLAMTRKIAMTRKYQGQAKARLPRCARNDKTIEARNDKNRRNDKKDRNDKNIMGMKDP